MPAERTLPLKKNTVSGSQSICLLISIVRRAKFVKGGRPSVRKALAHVFGAGKLVFGEAKSRTQPIVNPVLTVSAQKMASLGVWLRPALVNVRLFL